jgi:hypothetical protein
MNEFITPGRIRLIRAHNIESRYIVDKEWMVIATRSAMIHTRLGGGITIILYFI